MKAIYSIISVLAMKIKWRIENNQRKSKMSCAYPNAGGKLAKLALCQKVKLTWRNS